MNASYSMVRQDYGGRDANLADRFQGAGIPSPSSSQIKENDMDNAKALRNLKAIIDENEERRLRIIELEKNISDNISSQMKDKEDFADKFAEQVTSHGKWKAMFRKDELYHLEIDIKWSMVSFLNSLPNNDNLSSQMRDEKILKNMQTALEGFKTISPNTVMVWLENILDALTVKDEPVLSPQMAKKIIKEFRKVGWDNNYQDMDGDVEFEAYINSLTTGTKCPECDKNLMRYRHNTGWICTSCKRMWQDSINPLPTPSKD